MEKGPKIRIVGGASDNKKEQAKNEIEQALFNHSESLPPRAKENLGKYEYLKSKTEVAIIDFANIETARLMEEAGIEPYNIPMENYHIIPSDLYKEVANENGNAETFYTKQLILFDAPDFKDNPVNFGAVALHETLHLKAHFSMEVQEENGEINKTPYREGVGVRALQSHGYHGKYHIHFFGLHEAIVSEAEKKLLNKLLDLPELKKEKDSLASDGAKELRKKLAEKKEILEDDIFWVDTNKNDWEIIPYYRQREVLNYMCIEIQKQFPEKYQNVDDVFKEFLKAHFTGRLLSLARLVEKVFGEGSFRLLGNMDTSKESGVLHLESLKKARVRQTKGKT